MSITLSSHVLDLDSGRPASGLAIALTRINGDVVFEAVTDEDGRVSAKEVSVVSGEALNLRFATGAWYAGQGSQCFYPHVDVNFLPDETGHYHVPLLINRHGYSTYRGS